MHRVFLRQDGSALIVVLLLVAVMLALGAFGSRGAQIELRIAQNELQSKKALNAAEAGLNHAYNVIKTAVATRTIGQTYTVDLLNGGTGGTLGGLSSPLLGAGTLTTLDGSSYRFTSFGGTTSDGYYVRLSDNYDEAATNDANTDLDYRAFIVSQGRVGGAQRTISALVQGSALFGGALFGKTFITISGSLSRMDSYDSSLGAYSVATAGSNGSIRSDGNISLSGGATVHGDATSSTTVSTSGGSAVTGTTTNNAPQITYPAVAACGPPYSGVTGITGGSYSQSTGQLRASSLATSITLAAGTYCFSTFILSGGAQLTVNSAVKIYLTSYADFSGGSVSNTTQNAANLQIYSAETSQQVKLSGGSGAYMTVYAPNAPMVFSGGSNLYGAFVGYNLTNTGGTAVHYDTNMNILGPGAVLANWHEVR
jgi:type IV pilus assembly PilX-like protein